MRVWTFAVMFIGISILMTLAGLDFGAGSLLENMGLLRADDGSGINSNNLFRIAVFAIIAAATVAGIVIGFVTRAQSENFIMVPIIIGTGILFVDLAYGVIIKGFTYGDWYGYITLLLFGPLAVGFILSLIDWFRGND